VWLFVQLRIWFVLAFLAGIVLAYPAVRTAEVWCLVTAVVCAGIWVLAQRRWVWAVCFVLAFGCGVAYMAGVEATNRSAIANVLSSPQTAYPVQVRGTVATAPQVDGDRVRFVLLVQALSWRGETAAVQEKVQVTLRLVKEPEVVAVSRWRPGDVLTMPLTLTMPDGARNPGAFDYRRYLHEQRIHWLGEGRGLAAIKWERKDSWQGLVHDGRQRLARVLDELYDGPTADFLKGLLLGQREAVPPPLEEAFSSLGIAHILAISGGHVAIVAALAFFVFQLIGVTRERAIVWLLLLLPAYAVMTGMQVPVIRAVIMAAMALWALLRKRQAEHVQALFLTAGLMALWNPYWLFQASFQLSFLITFGLILWTDRLSQAMQQWLTVQKWPLLRRWWPPLMALLSLTVVAQLVSFPLIIAYFHEYSLLSTVANLTLVTALSFIVLPLGYATLLLGAVHPGAAYALAQLNQHGCDWLLSAASRMAEWRWFVTTWPTPSLIWMVVYYGLWAWWVAFLPPRSSLPPVGERHGRTWTIRWPLFEAAGLRLRKAAPALLMLLLAAWVAIGYLPHAVWERGARVTFLDVGQGDAIVVETPREVWLIDGGGRLLWEREAWRQREDAFDVGEDVVLPYLLHRGIRKIDGLVLTHGDADHVQGLVAIARRLPVGMALVNGGPSTPVQEEVLAALRERGVPVYRAVAGLRWSTEKSIQWEVLHPPAGPVINDNRHSVVLRLAVYGRELLFTGDLDVQGEMELVAAGRVRPADVLKVAHHGSDTSTSEVWLSAVRPALAVISVGKNNIYGHPAKPVLERLDTAGVVVLRTDRDGAVTLRFFPDGRWHVKTEFEGQKRGDAIAAVVGAGH